MRIFWRIASLFWKYRRQAALAYFCLFGGAAMSITIPQFTGRAIDLAIGSSQAGLLITMAVAIGVAGVLRGLLNYGQTYLAEALSQKVAYDLRKRHHVFK